MDDRETYDECFGCGKNLPTAVLTEMDDDELYCEECLDFYSDDDET